MNLEFLKGEKIPFEKYEGLNWEVKGEKYTSAEIDELISEGSISDVSLEDEKDLSDARNNWEQRFYEGLGKTGNSLSDVEKYLELRLSLTGEIDWEFLVERIFLLSGEKTDIEICNSQEEMQGYRAYCDGKNPVILVQDGDINIILPSEEY
jgi:hypothetical protein